MGMNVKEVGSALRAAGMRATKQRIAILRALSEAARPLTIQELLKRLPSPRPDLVTLYRTVETLGKAGVVERVHFASNEAHYEMKHARDEHHIVCTACDTVEHFADESHVKAARRALKRSCTFSQLTGHSFELFGVCNSCAASRA